MDENSKDEPIKWLSEIADIKASTHDPLAEEILRRFNSSVSWQSSEQVNGKPLREVLRNCWEQQNGILSCNDLERARSLGVEAVVNITALKVGVANSFMSDAFTSGSSELPWVIQPTPRPDISPIARDNVLQEIKGLLFNNGISDSKQLIEAVRLAKNFTKKKEVEEAMKASREMTSLMQDQCVEGKFHKAIKDFLQYFPVYPYAVFTGPYVTRAPKLVWGKNKPRLSTEVFPTFRAISPFDFCYSPDSPDTQRGTCVFTRSLWTRKELIDAAKLKSYLSDNVLEVLKQADTKQDFNLEWLSRSPDSVARDMALWHSNVSPIEVLTHYGVMSGRELQKYDIQGLDALEYYNCEIALVGYRVIQVKVLSDPNMNTRPIYTASFYKTGGDRIAGDGIAQRVRDIERAYHSCLMFLMRNASNASAPMCEADFKRLQRHMSEEDLTQIIPGTMYLADNDIANSGKPAMNFFNIPSNMPAYVQLMEMFMQLADRITNIPASLHGEAVGSGAMRTFRGMSMLQGNATKALHSAVDNISLDVFAPMGEYLYNLNMLYSKDSTIKGDSQIVTKGAEGILQKEIEKQTAMEILQIVGGVGAQLGQSMNLAPVITWGVKKLLTASGVPDDVVDSTQMVPQQPSAQPTAPMGSVPGGGSTGGAAGVAADIGGTSVV